MKEKKRGVKKRQMKRSYFIIFLIFLLILLVIRSIVFFQQRPVHTDGEVVKISTTVATEPQIVGKSQKFTIKLPYGEKASVLTAKFPSYSYGQAISISGKLKISEKYQTLSVYYPDINVATLNGNGIIDAALFIREKAIHLSESSLSPIDSSLLLGVVFGIKRDMPQEFLDAFKNAGVMHVIAASGMNVSMVAAALMLILSRVFHRRVALVLGLIGVIFYAFIAGLEPSIIRATIMAGFACVAGVSGKQRMPLYILFLTGVVMLFIDPSLLFDIGFQLSFLATAGIILLNPLFAFLQKGRIGGVIGEDLATTLSAQLATMPILLANFGSTNLLSLGINMLVLWTVPPLMIIGGIGMLIGLLIPSLGVLFLYISLPFLWYFETVILIARNFEVPITISDSSVVLWVGYYLILIAVILFSQTRGRERVEVVN